LRPSLLAGLVLAAPATTPVPMRLRLTIVRRRPLLCRGLRWFYCHDAYASCGGPAQVLSGFLRKAEQMSESTAQSLKWRDRYFTCEEVLRDRFSNQPHASASVYLTLEPLRECSCRFKRRSCESTQSDSRTFPGTASAFL
jgi:hypothetical protein